MEPLEILLETPDLAVCVKPAGVLSQTGKPGEASMITLLETQLGSAVYPVHRLDREAGGVMVYAKTQASAALLTRQIQQGTLEKEYLAVIRGCPEKPSDLLTDLLFHDSRRNKTYPVDRKRKGVREARLFYRVLNRRADCTLVQVRLLTGRTHQIRVQFASRGMPLLGDGRYGGGSGPLRLWSAALTFLLPGEGLRRFVRLPDRLDPFTAFPPLSPLPPPDL